MLGPRSTVGRLVLGMLQMFLAAFAAVLIYELGVTPATLMVALAACVLSTAAIVFFGRHDRERHRHCVASIRSCVRRGRSEGNGPGASRNSSRHLTPWSDYRRVVAMEARCLDHTL